MGLIKMNSPGAMIVGFIMLIVGVEVLVEILPDLFTALINLSNVSNLSFSGFFESGGVVFLLVSVAVLLAIFGILGIAKGSKR